MPQDALRAGLGETGRRSTMFLLQLLVTGGPSVAPLFSPTCWEPKGGQRTQTLLTAHCSHHSGSQNSLPTNALMQRGPSPGSARGRHWIGSSLSFTPI